VIKSNTKFRYVNNTLIYNVWDNDFGVIKDGNFCELFKEQLKNENISINSICIFDCTNEGVGIQDIEIILNSLSKDFPNLEIRVLFNIYTKKKTSYRYVCFPEHMVAHCRFLKHVNSLNIDWEKIVINKYFLSLQRRASVGRLKFSKQLLDNFNKSQYILSCATQPNMWLNKTQEFVDVFEPYTLPILVDGIIDNESKQHYHTNVDFFKCFVNVVTETSSQTDNDSWRDIFLTEKTFKVFAYRQLPIWFAVPGTVQLARDLGFDVFDDIIDHSYDQIDNETARMTAVVNELKRFCNNYSINEIRKLRTNLWERISSNNKLLNNLLFKHPQLKRNCILELIK